MLNSKSFYLVSINSWPADISNKHVCSMNTLVISLPKRKHFIFENGNLLSSSYPKHYNFNFHLFRILIDIGLEVCGLYKTHVVLTLLISKRFLLPYLIVMSLWDELQKDFFLPAISNCTPGSAWLCGIPLAPSWY